MSVFANVISYGLAVAAAGCLATALAGRVSRAAAARRNRD